MWTATLVIFVLTILLGQYIDQLWAMINGFQILQYQSLFNAKTPGNVNHFLSFFE